MALIQSVEKPDTVNPWIQKPCCRPYISGLIFECAPHVSKFCDDIWTSGSQTRFNKAGSAAATTQLFLIKVVGICWDSNSWRIEHRKNFGQLGARYSAWQELKCCCSILICVAGVPSTLETNVRGCTLTHWRRSYQFKFYRKVKRASKFCFVAKKSFEFIVFHSNLSNRGLLIPCWW